MNLFQASQSYSVTYYNWEDSDSDSLPLYTLNIWVHNSAHIFAEGGKPSWYTGEKNTSNKLYSHIIHVRVGTQTEITAVKD